MCGIFGIGFQNGTTFMNPELARFMLRRLFFESEVRGYDATGVAFTNYKEINVLKAPMTAEKFVGTFEYNSANRKFFTLAGANSTISVLGHCRAKTKGTPKNNNNNHPIVAGSVVGVHNGVIDNDDEIFNRFRGYSNSFSRRGQVDSEVIFRLISYFSSQQSISISESIQRMSSFVKGSYACAMVERRNPFLLWLFRQSNPITLYHYTNCGVIIFASLSSIIQNAVEGMGLKKALGKANIIALPKNRGLCINLFSNKMTNIKLNEDVYSARLQD